jgi:hypothetical protein
MLPKEAPEEAPGQTKDSSTIRPRPMPLVSSLIANGSERLASGEVLILFDRCNREDVPDVAETVKLTEAIKTIADVCCFVKFVKFIGIRP